MKGFEFQQLVMRDKKLFMWPLSSADCKQIGWPSCISATVYLVGDYAH